MPPKKKSAEPSKKTEQKKKEKLVEDKTFGLKNKKGNKQQKFIKTVSNQVIHGNKSGKELEKAKQDLLVKKESKKKELDELNTLFKPVEQKVGKGVDPKSVLCAFFKSGKCGKGDKCKFSHDLNIARKAEKRSVYDDAKKEEGMSDWNEEQLAEVVEQKHGALNKALPKTSIICKFFLDALENSKYGWFWKCPNGDACHYRHALPVGFVLKKDKKSMEEQKEAEISLEELIEKERASLSSKNLTKVTLESFLKWKDKKKKQKIAKMMAAKDRKKADYTSGKAFGVSGRDLFEFNPDLVVGDTADDDDANVFVMTRDDDEEDDEAGVGPVREIDAALFAHESEDVDATGTQAPMDRFEHVQAMENGLAHNDEESDKLDMAGAIPPDDGAAGAVGGCPDPEDDPLAEDTPIDENLFDGDDLDLVEEELETLDLVD